MLKKQVASLLIGAALMLTVAPSKTLSQSRSETGTATDENNLANATPKAGNNLKAAFASQQARIRTHPLTEVDFRGIEKEWQLAPAVTKTKPGWTKSEKLIFIGFLIGTTGLVMLLIKKGKVPQDCDESNPADPATCQILFGN